MKKGLLIGVCGAALVAFSGYAMADTTIQLNSSLEQQGTTGGIQDLDIENSSSVEATQDHLQEQEQFAAQEMIVTVDSNDDSPEQVAGAGGTVGGNAVDGEDNEVMSAEGDDEANVANLASQASRSTFGDAISGTGNVVGSYNIEMWNETDLTAENILGSMQNDAGASLGGEAVGGDTDSENRAYSRSYARGGNTETELDDVSAGNGGRSYSQAENFGFNSSRSRNSGDAEGGDALSLSSSFTDQTGSARTRADIDGRARVIADDDNLASIDAVQDIITPVEQDSASAVDSSATGGDGGTTASTAHADQHQDAASASAGGEGGSVHASVHGADAGDAKSDSTNSVASTTKGGDTHGGNGGDVSAMMATGSVGPLAMANASGVIALSQSTGFNVNQMTSVNLNAHNTMR